MRPQFFKLDLAILRFSAIPPRPSLSAVDGARGRITGGSAAPTGIVILIVMDQEQLRALLEQVRSGAVEVDAAVDRMRHLPFEDLGFAKVDHHRALRHGMPEVIFAQGKTPEQVVGHCRKAAGALGQCAHHPCRPRMRRGGGGETAGRRVLSAFPALSASGATAPCAAKAT